MEDLLKIKEAELTQLTQVKDVLRAQVKKFREEINSLNQKIELLENEPKKPSYPDLSDELKDQEEKNKKLLEEIELLKKEIEELKKEPLSPEKLMEQLKKGMFTLGKQNASIESKIDSILEQVEKGYQGNTKVEVEKKEKAWVLQKKPADSEPEKIIARKPSDVLKKKPVEEIPKKKIPAKVEIGTIKSISYPEDGVIKCPHCGEQSFQEQQNKKKIISYAPIKKYAKKYYCKICRGEWNFD
jgi:predicted  nucleic acid-binding Zn-ribbon protein